MNLRYLFLLLCATHIGWAQAEEVLSANVRDVLQRSVSDHAALKPSIALQHDTWLNEMSSRLQKQMPNTGYRMDFLKILHYEAKRAGLEPELVLSLIEVKSNFNRQSVSRIGAQGYMQVMPFWVKQIGAPDHDLFNIRTNLRYGCTILRHYLDVEKGDLYRALGRYDGSLGKTEFPNKVRAAWQNHWGITTP
ncbi:MAG: lytic transglycosylase domain-containing protein [Gallionella sp.]|nr:lytic transglycosylase domain-containing protein [Gallionella sp.]